MERMQFTFYRSFYETLCKVEDERDRLAIYEAIASYSLDGKEPALTGSADVIFTSFRRTLELARMKAEKGRKGGKSSVASTNGVSNGSPVASTTDASNINVNINDNVNVNSNGNGDGGKAAGPTTEQVTDFFRKMNLKGDPGKFYAYNEANGWTVKNWQLAAVGWSEKEGVRDQETGRGAPKGDLLMKAVSKRKEA